MTFRGTAAPMAPGPPRRLSATVFVLGLATYLLFDSGHIQTIDVQESIAVSQSLVARGAVWIQGFAPIPGGGSVPGVGGHLYSGHDVGLALIFTPISLLGQHGVLSPTILEAAYSAVDPLAGALLLVVFFHFSVRLTDRLWPSVWATGVLGWCSIMFVYARIAFDAMPTALLLLCAFLMACRLTGERRWTLALAGGAAAGSACLVRIDSAVLVLAATVWVVASSLRHPWLPRLRIVAAWLAPLAVAAAVNVWYDIARFGSLFNYGHAHDPELKAVTPLWYGLAGNLISPGKGLIVYTPPLLIATAGWWALGRRRPALAASVLLAFAAYLVVVSRFAGWSGAEAWGPRFLVPSVPLLMLPLATVLSRWGQLRWSRLAIVVLAVLGLLVQIPGVTTEDVAIDRLHGGALQATAFHNSGIIFGWQALWRGLHGVAPYPSTLQGGIIPPPVPRLDLWWLGASPPVLSHPTAAKVVAAVLAAVAAATFAYLLYVGARSRPVSPPRPAA